MSTEDTVLYKPLIQDMTWSFSRIEAFEDCPYRWYLRYIKQYKESGRFYASYGSFMHKLIERYYRGELSKDEMLMVFLTDFGKEVVGYRPKEATLNKYIDSGIAYLKSFQPFPYKMVDVEVKVEFTIDGIPFLGFIDFLGEDEDGELVIVDNKSRELKPRSGRDPPTRKDKELDEMLPQLYIYSAAVEQKYGRLPKKLCFNCFRNGEFIEEQFDQERYEREKRLVVERVRNIENTEEFPPIQNAFGCFWICGVSEFCKYDIADREERRRSR